MASGVLCCVGDWPETWAQATAPVQAVANSQAASWCTVIVAKNLLHACRVHGLSEPVAGELAASTPVAFGTFPHLIAAAWAPDGFCGAPGIKEELTLREAAIGAASASCLEGFVAAAKRKLTQVPDGEQGKKQRRLLNGTVRELERAVHAQKEAARGPTLTLGDAASSRDSEA